MVAILIINNCKYLGQEFVFLLTHYSIINHNNDSSYLLNVMLGIKLIDLHFHITLR